MEQGNWTLSTLFYSDRKLNFTFDALSKQLIVHFVLTYTLTATLYWNKSPDKWTIVLIQNIGITNMIFCLCQPIILTGIVISGMISLNVFTLKGHVHNENWSLIFFLSINDTHKNNTLLLVFHQRNIFVLQLLINKTKSKTLSNCRSLFFHFCVWIYKPLGKQLLSHLLMSNSKPTCY